MLYSTFKADSLVGRRPTYKRKSKTPTATTSETSLSQEVVILSDTEPGSPTTEVSQMASSEPETTSQQESVSEDVALDIDEPQAISEIPYVSFDMEVNILCDKDADPDVEEECFDFQDEMLNFDKLMMFTRD